MLPLAHSSIFFHLHCPVIINACILLIFLNFNEIFHSSKIWLSDVSFWLGRFGKIAGGQLEAAIAVESVSCYRQRSCPTIHWCPILFPRKSNSSLSPWSRFEQINEDQTAWCSSASKSTVFFLKCILSPEILCKLSVLLQEWYSLLRINRKLIQSNLKQIEMALGNKL